MTRAQSRFRNRVIVPISLVVTTLIVAILLLLLEMSNRQTSEAVVQQRALAQGMIGLRMDEMRNTANDYAYWDDAYVNLVRNPDMAWAHTQVGTALADRYGYDMVFVVDPEGTTTFGMVRGVMTRRNVDEILKNGYYNLLHLREIAGDAQTATGILTAMGEPVFVVVSPLRPVQGEDTTADKRHLLIAVDFIDRSILSRLANIYHLPGLRFAETDAETDSYIDFRTINRQVTMRLVWDAADPGSQMLREILPIIGVLVLVIIALTALILRQAAIATQRLEASERRALHDPLTGLRNRAALFGDLEEWPEEGTGLQNGYALLYADLDGFKQVNDTYGHASGDDLLREVGARLRNALSAGAEAYRIGGDEFAIVLPGVTDTNTIRLNGLRVIEAVCETPFTVGDDLVTVGMTIGVATSPRGKISPADLLRRADMALYSGKRDIRGTIRFYVDVIDVETTLNRIG